MIATAMMFAVALNANASQVSPVPTEKPFRSCSCMARSSMVPAGKPSTTS